MLDTEILNQILLDYKKDFVTEQWPHEKFKWQAIKHFQENWDIDAPDFQSMFGKATELCGSLLTSVHYFPRGVLMDINKDGTEYLRSMFKDLFDESKDLAERVERFEKGADVLKEKFYDYAKSANKESQHFQNRNSISTYLWLRYPDKYYIYKYSEYSAAAKKLETDFQPKRKKSIDNLIKGFEMYDAIRENLAKDDELVQQLHSAIDDSCYPDANLNTLTIDFGFYISRKYSGKIKRVEEPTTEEENKPSIWKISHGTKDFSDEEDKIFAENHVIVVHKDTGAKAASKETQGESFMHVMKKGDYFYLCYGNKIQLLGRVLSEEATQNPEKGGGWYQREYEIVAESKDKSAYTTTKKWWTPNHNSTCIEIKKESDRKLFEELILQPYFDKTISDLLGYEPTPSNSTDGTGYWWLNANPKIWTFSNLAVGEAQSYTLYNDSGHKRRYFQYFQAAKEGDLVIGYESTPNRNVVALAKVAKASDGQNIYFEKTEGLASPISYDTLKALPELQKMEYFANPQGSLFKLTKEEYDAIIDAVREENPVAQKELTKVTAYTKDKFLSDVYMTEDRLDTLISLLNNKQNVILQGAPGVGKTFVAKRLAYVIMGNVDDSRIEFVQFHQNYSYEDFMMGYKPQGDGFELQNGIFYRFCQKAANTPDKPFFFIIDEINRGNMSKIFGELLMLIEKDYRGTKATLAYNGLSFSVPKNLYLIGMMNTADRSLAMIDYALRRRFSFFEMQPGFDSEGFKVYQSQMNNKTFDKLIEVVKELNKAIAEDSSLGSGFCIGHSYFCGQAECTKEWMNEVVEFDIVPMLQEYWFDNPTKWQEWKNKLTGALND